MRRIEQLFMVTFGAIGFRAPVEVCEWVLLAFLNCRFEQLFGTQSEINKVIVLTKFTHPFEDYASNRWPQTSVFDWLHLIPLFPLNNWSLCLAKCYHRDAVRIYLFHKISWFLQIDVKIWDSSSSSANAWEDYSKGWSLFLEKKRRIHSLVSVRHEGKSSRNIHRTEASSVIACLKEWEEAISNHRRSTIKWYESVIRRYLKAHRKVSRSKGVTAV